MLVYVDIIPTKKGFLNRLRGAATGFSPEVTKKTFLNCPYLSVGIHSASKRILKKQVDSVIPKTDRVVCSKDFPSELLKNYDFVKDCKELKARLLLNFLKSVLKNVNCKRNLKVLLIDWQGTSPAAAAELIPFCRVYVLTDRFELYSPCREYCRIKYGEAPIMAQKLSGLTAAFAPFGTRGLILPNSQTPVFSQNPHEGFCLDENFLSAFNEFDFPKNANKELFLEAFFENFCPPKILEACPKSVVNQGFSADLNYFIKIFSA